MPIKILVTAKRVEDYESKIKVNAQGTGIVLEGLKYKINPFDEIGVEEALRLVAKHGGGEVVVVSIGTKDVHEQLRHALAMGATRALWVNHQGPLDQLTVAAYLQKIVEKEKPSLAILGKQSIDDDQNQVGQYLAALPLWWSPPHSRHPLHPQDGRGAPASARPSTPLATHPPTHHRPALAASGWLTDTVKQVHRACP